MKRIFLGFLTVTCLVGLLIAAKGLVGKVDHYEGLGGDFSLTNHDKAPMNLEDYRGKVILLTFGYTHCPDICPANLVRLKQLVEKFGPQSDQIQTFFVSVDPERDTPEHLKKYVTFFNPEFVGLTGSPEALEQVTRQYGSAFFKQEEKSAAGYLVAHTDYIFLVDQEGRLREFYKTGATLGEMEAGVQSLLN